jgi:hypothetical protein
MISVDTIGSPCLSSSNPLGFFKKLLFGFLQIQHILMISPVGAHRNCWQGKTLCQREHPSTNAAAELSNFLMTLKACTRSCNTLLSGHGGGKKPNK